ncbi:hypothetical protein CNMCM7691_005652 [Aspergillus felis]|uniref:Uncharacterized protein n=1 Tax=Aspergillus felis TaxID=1287682 RepID=A0A8H6R3I2_9EURO|nr:hypothetical protein CNMCM7691_005652 [Aspergillus felis]
MVHCYRAQHGTAGDLPQTVVAWEAAAVLEVVLEEVADDWGVMLVPLEEPMAGVVEALMGQMLLEEVEEVRTAQGYYVRERSWQLAPR